MTRILQERFYAKPLPYIPSTWMETGSMPTESRVQVQFVTCSKLIYFSCIRNPIFIWQWNGKPAFMNRMLKFYFQTRCPYYYQVPLALYYKFISIASGMVHFTSRMMFNITVVQWLCIFQLLYSSYSKHYTGDTWERWIQMRGPSFVQDGWKYQCQLSSFARFILVFILSGTLGLYCGPGY